ncbi:MAG: DUF3025 domain-containing protein [Burkholderiaceae bacterium]
MEDRLLARALSNAPWAAAWLALLEEFLERKNVRGEPYHEALCALFRDRQVPGAEARWLDYRFVAPQAASARAYESRIHDAGEIETRENVHDLLNALAWTLYPQTKAAINHVHVRELGTIHDPATRGRARDAATLLDESGILVVFDDPRMEALVRSAPWTDLFVEHRRAFLAHCVVLIVGHALAEKLVSPYKALTAHALLVHVPSRELEQARAGVVHEADRAAARALMRTDLAPGQLIAVPVLGIPGFCAANEDPHFYADSAVFRPRRRDS